jgi:spore coat polysaccharide biosynthesis predicted glycosyltransferase SpsG
LRLPAPEPKPLVVRCDADEQIGLGHVGRAFAVAEALADRLGVEPVLVGRESAVLDGFVAGRRMRFHRLTKPGYAPDDVLSTLEDGSVLVSDTYELTQKALDRVAAGNVRHVVIDDFARLRRWPCDVVVNPNIGASAAAYEGARRVLVGSPYALVRREIAALRREGAPPRSKVRRVIVALSGGAWRDAGRSLLEHLVEVVGGGVEVRVATRESCPGPLEPVPPETLAEHLAWADLGLLGGGVVKYEAACLGLPALLLAVVPHQAAVAAAYAATGAGGYLGELGRVAPPEVAAAVAGLVEDAASVRRMSEAATALVDGRGAERVADALLEVAGA